MFGIIIQARMGSTRLPSKMGMPFYKEQTIPDILIEKLKIIFPKTPIILATSINPLDDKLEDLGKKNGIEVFRGSEDDVLNRFIEAAEKYSLSKIIRICADNPFLDLNGLKEVRNSLDEDNWDYVSFKTSKGIPVIKTHYGFWAEGVSLKALKKASSLTSEKFFREHVTNFIYTHKEFFKIKLVQIPQTIEKYKIRLTVDTLEDFELSRIIYKEQYINCISNIEKLLNLIDSNPKWLQIMNSQIEKNSK